MACQGCNAGKLGEAVKLLRKRGFLVHRELRDCLNCKAENLAAEAAKERGAAGVVFWTSAEAARVGEEMQRRAQAEKANAAGLTVPVPRVALWVSTAEPGGGDAAARAVLEVAVEVGLDAEWSGSAESAVALYM